jgi:hypothetical protein
LFSRPKRSRNEPVEPYEEEEEEEEEEVVAVVVVVVVVPTDYPSTDCLYAS